MLYVKFLLVSSLLGVSQATIDESLIKALKSGGSADVLVDFGGNQGAIQKVSERSFRSRSSKVKTLTSALQSLADQSQGGVQKFLKEQNVESQSFWSSNQMVIKDANLDLLQGVDEFPEVSRIQSVPKVELDPTPQGNAPRAVNVEYGIAKIQVDKVWENFKTQGEGVVVANIDTGVRGTHEALAGNFRQDHGWFDPYKFSKTVNDVHGHGSHTMGTIVGQGGIGVAPRASWIACRGCDNNGCETLQLLWCGQWMLAPTLPDGFSDRREDLIPDIVSNSWGSSRGANPWYNYTIAAWKAAGILHAFAIGNSGPRCSSTGSPGDQPSTFSVGSTDENDRLSIFSSKGPAFGLGIPPVFSKPDIVAPGSDVRSAWYDGDNSYNTISGTSMACPHVAGVMALMLSAYRSQTGNSTARLDHNRVVENIQNTAVKTNLTLSIINPSCDSIFQGKDVYPNNQFGHGRIDALGAVVATLNDIGNEN